MREPEGKKKPPRKKKDGEDEEEEEDAGQVLPAFEKGERGPHRPEIKSLTTKPPKPYTEASLLQAMETAGKQVDDETLREALKEKGIGTPATRAAIIETLIGRSYVERNKKQLRGTEAGRTLIAMVHDERLKSPELTGDWEAHLKQIEQGRYDPASFMAQVIEHTRKIIGQSGEVQRAPHELGACPLCGGRVIEGSKGYGCSRWKAGCKFVVWKEQFGAALTAAQIEELLANRKTTRPQHLVDGGRHFYGTLTLDAAGQVGCKRAGRRAKAGDRAILGECPLCGSDVVEGDKAFGCLNWKGGCTFRVWKEMSKRAIPKDMVRVLLKDGATPFIQKFTNKQGTRFDARLKLVDGKVEFDFTPTRDKNTPETP
jgi:DNA topoisomerase-3